MLKLCINSRDELFVLDLDKVAYIQASGNYSRIVYIGGMQMMITLGLSKLEGMIKMIVPKDRRSVCATWTQPACQPNLSDPHQRVEAAADAV